MNKDDAISAFKEAADKLLSLESVIGKLKRAHQMTLTVLKTESDARIEMVKKTHALEHQVDELKAQIDVLEKTLVNRPLLDLIFTELTLRLFRRLKWTFF